MPRHSKCPRRHRINRRVNDFELRIPPIVAVKDMDPPPALPDGYTYKEVELIPQEDGTDKIPHQDCCVNLAQCYMTLYPE